MVASTPIGMAAADRAAVQTVQRHVVVWERSCQHVTMMRQRGMSAALAFDPHFAERGFQLV